MPIRSSDLERMYQGKLGAELRVGKHRIYTIWHDGRKLAITEISHGSMEYSESLLGRVAKQLKVNRRQLQDLLDCPMSRSDYVAHVLERDC